MDILDTSKGLVLRTQARGGYRAVMLPELQSRDVALDLRSNTALRRVAECAVRLRP
jgi:hypothetical protein